MNGATSLQASSRRLHSCGWYSAISSKAKSYNFRQRHSNSKRRTIPSSGPAYGGPLKSNVRRLWSRSRSQASESRFVSASACPTKLIVLLRRCPPSSSRAARPASLAVSARNLSVTSPPSRPGAPRQASLVFHASKIAGTGLQAWAVRSGLGSEPCTPLSVSKQLKPQCVVMHLHSCLLSTKHPLSRWLRVGRALSWRHVPGISPSKREPCLFLQPPNPSFKRTRLRRSA